ncbi:MAG: hypothetical protein QME16_07570, partial [Planctomycetota bacterium]|nr:hypothetical protein [Planctomycetota bacterium]
GARFARRGDALRGGRRLPRCPSGTSNEGSPRPDKYRGVADARPDKYRVGFYIQSVGSCFLLDTTG